MHRSLRLPLLALAGGLAAGLTGCASQHLPRGWHEEPRREGGIESNIGIRSLPEATWGPIRHQAVFGVGLLVPLEVEPLAFEINGSFSIDDDGSRYVPTETRGRIWELAAGVRATLGERGSVLRPYVAAGLSGLYARIDDYVADQVIDDTTLAPYVRVGFRLDIGRNEYVGLEWRATSNADLEFTGDDNEADYHQFTLVLGGAW